MLDYVSVLAKAWGHFSSVHVERSEELCCMAQTRSRLLEEDKGGKGGGSTWSPQEGHL